MVLSKVFTKSIDFYALGYFICRKKVYLRQLKTEKQTHENKQNIYNVKT